MEESVLSLKGKKHNICFPTFEMPANTKTMLWLTYYFDDYGIWLLGYMIEFSCLDITQREVFHPYFVALKYRWKCIF